MHLIIRPNPWGKLHPVPHTRYGCNERALHLGLFGYSDHLGQKFGFLKETLVAPVSRMEIILGQTFGGDTTAVIQAIMIMVFPLFLGVNVQSIFGFLIALGFMILIGISFTAFSIAIALRMEDLTGFQRIMNCVIFPIFGLSGAMFPISSLPGWLGPITIFDPLIYGVEGIRYWLTGVSQISPAIIFWSSTACIMTIIGSFLFRKISI
ncbi:ABC transporter permease [Methanospirillum sp.]|uniref:ABC transporter permease n=1 Tax=Methanospirillum sp. TaxID=45200 RepID=UPI00345D6635